MAANARNEAILKIIKQRTEVNTATRETARETLISEGIYTKSGKLRIEYGGSGKRAKTRT